MTSDSIQGRLKRISEFMERRLEECGASPQGLYWKDQQTMNIRFDKVLEVVDQSSPCRIADLGCGYGGLYERCQELKVNLSEYIGYDVSEKMLETARNRIRAKGAQFIIAGCIDRKVDYAIACGIFNTKLDDSDELWQDYVEKTIDNLNEHAERGFSFNNLTSYVDYREEKLYYADPLYFFDLCKRRYSRRVSLLHDYDLWEWTIIVRK